MALEAAPVPALDDETLAAFAARLRGDLLVAAHPDYDAARRVWNGMIDKRPAVIVRCHGTNDVLRAVEFGRAHNLVASVRGGGHNVAGNAVCDGGLLIDLTRMRGIRVDPVARTVRAQPGSTYHDFDAETQAFGLATTGGTVSETGIAGLTLGGGLGWLMGKHGLACDNLIAADVVTADGQFVVASEAENPDLLWGLRGGGGNFGVVTSFEYRVHPLGPVLAGLFLFPIARAREVLDLYRALCLGGPDDLSAMAILVTLPGVGERALIAVCHSGADHAAAEPYLAPIRAAGPLADTVQVMPYGQLQHLFDRGAPAGSWNYWKSHFVADLTDAALDTVVAHGTPRPGALSSVVFECVHGAAARVSPGATAFAQRGLRWNVSSMATTPDPAEIEPAIQWARQFADAIQPYATGGAYVNYLNAGEGTARVRGAFGGNYERLVALKRRYDPTNFFRMNQNVDPRG